MREEAAIRARAADVRRARMAREEAATRGRTERDVRRTETEEAAREAALPFRKAPIESKPLTKESRTRTDRNNDREQKEQW